MAQLQIHDTVKSPLPTAGSPGSPARVPWTGTLAVIVLGVLGFCAAFTHVWDSDVPWHLACGEWMLRHHQIMGHDYFSINPEKVWVNVHWLFQVIVAAIYSVAGYDGLSLLKGVVCAAGMIIFALALRRHVPAGWLIFCGALMLYVFQSRIRVRPELFTLSLLIAVILLLDSIRRGASPNRMWLMVPIMLFWANMHGVFVVGWGIMWAFIFGALVDAIWGKWTSSIERQYAIRPVPPDSVEGSVPPLPTKALHRPWWTRLITWHSVNMHGNMLSPMVLAAALAATGVCLLTPWPLEVPALTFTLSTRISGGVYTEIVTELRPLVEVVKDEKQTDAEGKTVWTKPKPKFADEGDPYIAVPFIHRRIYNASLQFHTEAILLFCLTLLALIFNARRVPVTHAVLLLVFGYLAISARRNVGLVAPLAGVLLALHGGTFLNFARAWKPTLARVGKPFAALMAVAVLLMSAGYATGTIFKWYGHGELWGPGRQPLAQADAAAAWLGELPVDGDVLTENFGDGGVFIYYANHGADEPRRLSYMDGRLEAHTLERFLDIDRIRGKLANPVTAETDVFRDKSALQNKDYDLRHDFSAPLPPTVRFIFVNSGTCNILTAMMQTKRFQLRYIEPGGVIFEKMDWQPPADAKQDMLLGEPNFGDLDRPLNNLGLLDNHEVFTATWYRQFVPDIDTQMGDVLTWLGTQGNNANANTANSNQKRCSLLAIRYLNAAWTQGLGDRQRINSYMARAYHWRSWQGYVGPSDILPADLRSARAMRLFADVTVSALGDEANNHHTQWTLALEHAGQMDTYFKLLDGWLKMDPQNNTLQTTAQASASALKDLKAAATNDGVYNLPPIARAYVLAGTKYRLTEEAIATLQQEASRIQSGPRTSEAQADLSRVQLLLGDMMLRKGLAFEAQAAYQQVQLPPADAWQLELRAALVDWVGGPRMAPPCATPYAPIGFNNAVARLRNMVRQHGDKPILRYYLAEMLEDLGYNDEVEQLRSQPDVAAFARAATERSQDMVISPVKAFSGR